MDRTRERTLALVDRLTEADMDRVHDPLMSPLVWDIGHIAAFEDLWLCHHAGGLTPLRPDLMHVYDAFETPRARRGDVPFLRRDDALAFTRAVRERALAVLADVELDSNPLLERGFVFELVLAHEQQHNETMLQTLQLAQPGVYSPKRAPLPAGSAADEMVTVPGGTAVIGAAADGFAYDNERARHAIDVESFAIDRAPVTNAQYAQFADAGGYGCREWWSDSGWHWRVESSTERPLYWTSDGRQRRFDRIDPIDPFEPVMHVSWYEADAYARWCGKRLPSEAEWEKAASGAGGYPWGDQPSSAIHANLGQAAFGPAQVGAYPAGDAVSGASGMLGDAWEWTASDFDAYPGFRPFPYPEYSEPFFGAGYKVLRGGSWATSPDVARNTFRNWDLPQRRQIFAGFRCAADL